MKRSKSIQAVIRRARAQGRAEAVTIIASLCPEDGIDGLIGSSPNGESGDYSSYWDVDALRKLLCADTEVCDKIDRLQGAHEFTHYLKHDLAKAQTEAELHEQVQRAACELPERWEIQICIEKGASTVELYRDGDQTEFWSDADTLAGKVDDAIETARAGARL
ncbi:hypothetical protein AB4P95_30015 (plasmid) [Pseudomonas sp. A1437]|uniref:hypothetical protein n=1 Tax=Pseudomonas sp. A1437 TaxID=3235107 RepID=UPI00378483B9